MADAPKLNGNEFIDESYYKINMGIDNANEALKKSFQAEVTSNNAVYMANDAVGTANAAETRANSVQEQFNQVIIEGDSSVEAAQARVNISGISKETLKDRIDDDYLTLIAKLGEIIQINAKDFGASTDGTDNLNAFAKISQFINNNPNDNFEIFFPHGEYKYSDGLFFFKHVKLKGNSAILNYTGNAKALELGSRNLTISNYQTQFIIDGLTFTGGQNMTHGIFVNRFVTKPKFLNTTFSNFGNPTAYSLWLNGDNWDTMLFNFSWYSNTTYKQNFFKVNSQNLNSTRVRILGSVLTNQSVVRGMGVWLDGGYCEIAHSKVEGFSPNVRLGSLCAGTSLNNMYFETVDNGSCIVFGDDVGTPRESSYLQNITIKDVYCNLHSHDLGTIANFIAPANPLTGLQNAYIDTINLTGLKSDMEAIKLNNVGSQINNSAKNFYGANIIRTTGNNISKWEGVDFTSTKGIDSKGQITTNVLSRFQNDVDSAGYLDVRAGKTSRQYSGYKISDFAGNDIFIIEVSPTNATNFKNSDGTFMSVSASRKVGFGKVPSNDTLEVNGCSSADGYYFNKTIDASTVRNGGLFIDTDGKLKFRDNAGTLKTIVTQ
ncbi:hypothetical protein LKM19_12950 [Bacillus cereus]|uniref:glycosyl hydrolase family 28-related protein n=1 Tax=Bacillus cereus TaxID=1396 RepID=UPI001D0E1924|nr:glycosyl hydrolase family 28-related protein [Bacillus cereus]MCC2361667.1 hypothetical protein [Bacillus cereus]